MSPRDGYMDLFPTRVSKFSLPKQLIEEALHHDSLETERFSYLDVLNRPEYQSLQNEVLKAVIPYCPTGRNIGLWKIISGWVNNQAPHQNGFGYHAHAESVMSCVLYLKGTNMSITFRDTAREAPQSNQENKVPLDLIVRRTWHKDITVQTEPGDLILFPSYLLHKPDKNDSDSDRISIAYNLLPTRVLSTDTPPWVIQYEI